MEVQLTQECINPDARSTGRLNFVWWLVRKIFGNQVSFYCPTNTFLLILYISSLKRCSNTDKDLIYKIKIAVFARQKNNT